MGTFDESGELRAIATGEAFLLTEYVRGQIYARDLEAAADRDRATELDLARAEALARYLVTLHSARAHRDQYVRDLRDTIGSGEGIFGIIDSYPGDHPVATAARLQAIERGAVRWRWTLRDRHERARRTHGDFHPFNVLFREGTDFSLLDCSRGGAGEPADDVTSMALNYLFFALTRRKAFVGALRELWDRFWALYLELSGDEELLEVVAPFFAWRGLVVASPLWYPAVGDAVREKILTFVEKLISGAPFRPNRIEELL
jgi:aminoglycoside phosphotransferase (APT) family kinase protein